MAPLLVACFVFIEFVTFGPLLTFPPSLARLRLDGLKVVSRCQSLSECDADLTEHGATSFSLATVSPGGVLASLRHLFSDTRPAVPMGGLGGTSAPGKLRCPAERQS